MPYWYGIVDLLIDLSSYGECVVCVCACVLFPFILDMKFVGRTSRGHTRGKSRDFSSTFLLRYVVRFSLPVGVCLLQLVPCDHGLDF